MDPCVGIQFLFWCLDLCVGVQKHSASSVKPTRQWTTSWMLCTQFKGSYQDFGPDVFQVNVLQITLGSWTGCVPSSLSNVAARASGVMLMEIREGVAESEVYLVVDVLLECPW